MASEDWPFTNAWSLHGNREIVSRYEILERIGEGTFGEVHRARRREDNLIVALKEIHDFDSSEREIKALLLLDHPNVVKLHEYFAQGSNMVLVLEYLPHNLAEVIQAGKGELSDAEVKGWMIQILRGLAACRAASILHRDLKPNNLLIAEDRTLKIADFGQARILSEVDFENEEGLSVSEIHKNYGTGSESQSGQDAPAMSNNQDLEFQADVSVAEGRIGDDTSIKVGEKPSGNEASGRYVGVRIGQSMEKENLLKAPVESIPLAKDFSSVPRDSDKHEGKCTHLGSGPTNVGFSALADAVKDTINYFTVEEMARSGTGIHGLGLSGLQRQQIIESQPTEDLVCCGWFPMENVENRLALTEGRNPSLRNASTGKDNVVSVGRDQAPEREDDFSSDESDVDREGNYGMRSEGVIDTLNETEESRKAGVSSSLAKGDGDFLQKVRRFIRKRTRRLNNDGKITGPLHSRNERIFTVGGNSLKAATQSDGHAPHMPRRLGPRQNASTERHSVNVNAIRPLSQSLRTATAAEIMVCSQGQRVYSRSPIWKGTRNSHRQQSKRFPVGSINDLGQGSVVTDGHRNDSMDEVSLVSGVEDEYYAHQCLVKEGDGSTVPDKPAELVDGEEDGGDLRTERGRKLDGGLKVEKVERKTRKKMVVNGPLREMAHARVHEVGETGATGQLEFKDNFRVDGRESSEVETGGVQMSSIDLKKSGGDEAKTMRVIKHGEGHEDFPWSHQKALTTPNAPAEEALETMLCETPSTWVVGENDVDNVEETLDGRWEGTAQEPIPSSDVCKSWTQTEGYNSTLSDSEGTRWYGAPEFQYSYMDSKIAGPAVGKVIDETYCHVTGSEEEWEKEGSEVGTYQNSSAHSQESIGRGNSESEHGSDFTTMVGTRWYKAPELLYGATKYGMGIDIWAVGCIFGELLWGKPLFPGLNDIDQLSRLVRILGSPNEKIWAGVSLLPDFNKICFVDDRTPLTLRKYLPHISDAALDFLQKLLTYDPALRLTAERALEDDFFLKLPLPCPRHELQLPAWDESEASDEEWGDWKDPGSPFSDFEILG